MVNQQNINPMQAMMEMQKQAESLKIEHPVIYADQLAAFAFGPFVSKVILAQESFPPGERKPVATLILPTNVLHQLAKDMSVHLSSPEAQTSMREAFEEYQKNANSEPKEAK